MFPTRLKMLAALLLFTIVGVGGIVGGHLYGSNPPSKEKADSDKNQPADPVDWKLKDTYLAGKMTNLSAVVLSPDGKLLATADDDKGVQLWDIAEGKEIDTLLKGGREKVRALAFSADGKTLAAGAGNDIYRWMVSTRKFLPALTPNGGDPSLRKDFKILTLAFSPDGKRLAQGGTSMACAVWDLEDIHASTSFVHNKESRGIVFNPDGKSVAVAGMFDSDWKKLNRPLPSLLVFDLARDDYGARMSYLEAGFNCVAYSADGTLLAAGSPDHAVHVFCLEKEDVRLEGHDDEVLGIEFAPKGDLLASCGKDKTIRIWDVQKQKLLATLKGHKKPVRLVQFSGDGRTLISVDDDGVVKIWVD
jgi:WD40 repeat protein